ncbi:MAG: biotin/lipoyl-containing protein [Anaerolineae bacterium]|jgi:biotin carboxyl carrier protein
MSQQRSQEFTLTLDGVSYKITMDGNSVLVNGQPFVVGLDEAGTAEEENVRVLVDGVPYDLGLSPAGDRVTAGGIAYDLKVEGLEREQPGARAAGGRAAAAGGAGAVRAIMPGKIIRVLIAEGDQVAEGDVVCILEAMKMENELKAPQAGTVKALYVEAGQDVENGAVLVDIE